MIKDLKEIYIDSIKNEFLHLTDMKKVKAKIEEMGFSTSRIYGYKNVKRLTATDDYKNRIEFVLSDKNFHILFSLNFSNKDTVGIDILSKEEIQLISMQKLSDVRQNVYSSAYNYSRLHDQEFEASMKEVFLIKNKIHKSRFADSTSAITNINNLRNEIILHEIDRKRLPDITKIRANAKNTLIKNSSEKIFEHILNSGFQFHKQMLLFVNREIFFGYFFYEDLGFRFNFDLADLEAFYQTEIIPYILNNKKELIEKISKKSDNYNYYYKNYIANIDFIDKPMLLGEQYAWDVSSYDEDKTLFTKEEADKRVIEKQKRNEEERNTSSIFDDFEVPESFVVPVPSAPSVPAMEIEEFDEIPF